MKQSLLLTMCVAGLVSGAAYASQNSDFDTYVVVPEAGKVTALTDFQVYFPNLEPDFLFAYGNKVSLTDGTKTYEIAKAGRGSYGAASYRFKIVDEEGEQITITDPGTYTFTCEPGTFEDQDYDTDEMISQNTNPIVAEYVIEVNPLAYEFTPAAGSTVALPEEDLKVIMTFPNAKMASAAYWGNESNPTGGSLSSGIRVLAGSDMVRRVDDPSATDGYSLANYDANSVVFTFSKSFFSTNKVLSIESDKGAFTVDEGPSPEFTYSLNVGEEKEYEWVLDPESGSELDSVGDFTLSFPNAQTAEMVEDPYIILSGNVQLMLQSVDKVEDADCPTFKLTFSKTDLFGSYSLYIEEGSFILDGKYSSPDIRANYTQIRTSEIDMSCTPSPMGDKAPVEPWGTYLAFVFGEYERIGYPMDYASKIKVTFDDVELTNRTDYTLMWDGDGVVTKLLINIDGNSPYTGKEGTITVTIPEGLLTITGQPFEGITKTWRLMVPPVFEYELTPAPETTVSDLSKIKIYFKQAEKVTLDPPNLVNIRKSDYTYFQSCTEVEYFSDENGAGVIMTFDPAPTADGDYTFNAYYGAFFIDELSLTDSFNVSYTLDGTSGIDSVAAQTGNVTVYSIDGRVVYEGADKAAVNSLDKGIYLINGKKVVVK